MPKSYWKAETPAVRIAALLAFGFMAAALATTQPLNPRAIPGKQPDGTYLVETEQRVKPWGTQTVIEGRPVDLAFDAKLGLLAVLSSSSIELRSAATSQLVGSFLINGASYAGIAFRPQTQEVWASEGSRSGEDSVFIGKFNATGHPTGDRRLKLKDHAVPIGLGFSPDGQTAYVVLSRHNAIGVFDANTLELKREIQVGLAPFALLVAPDGHRLFVTNRGHKPQPSAITADSAGTSLGTDRKTGAVLSGSITVIDLPSLARHAFPTGQAPAGLALRSDGKVLGVANAYSGTISLFNLLLGTTMETNIELSPHAPFGSQPIGCAFSADGRSLYVAAAGLNAIAVLNQQNETYTLSGFLPAGWYPSALHVIGGVLHVVNIKGDGSTLAPDGGHRARAFHGSLQTIPAGFEQRLIQGTDEVRQYNSALTNTNAPNSKSFGVKHVLLLVKENRTYDQVFGDLPQGSGDPKYLMFGRPITPNHHALAEQYVLFDNFYATGAISLDGHQWLEQGFVGDHVERALTTSPRGYAWDSSDALDVSPAGAFWLNPNRPLTVRFGGILSLPAEFQPSTQLTRDIDENDLHPWHYYWDAYQAHRWEGLVGSRASVPALAPYVDHRYPVNSMKIPDQIRASVIEQEFAEAERTGTLPELMAFGMTSDHTMGTDPQAPKPEAMVADNDLALGRIVEVVSHSRFWSSTLILVVEDDSQDGVDHVDGHRTVALAIGPMVKRGVVDSNFYTQLSLIRTIQALLGIQPNTRFQKNARIMDSIFAATPSLQLYAAITPQISLQTMNPPLHALTGKALWSARQSSGMNWNHVDDIPTALLNRILWWNHAGYNAAYPAPQQPAPLPAHRKSKTIW